jgi:hypothetical protein
VRHGALGRDALPAGKQTPPEGGVADRCAARGSRAARGRITSR